MLMNAIQLASWGIAEYLSEAGSKGSMHGGRKLARGALPSKIQPVTYALCHDVVVFSSLRPHTYTAVGPIHQGVLTPPCAACLQFAMQTSMAGPWCTAHCADAIPLVYSNHYC